MFLRLQSGGSCESLGTVMEKRENGYMRQGRGGGVVDWRTNDCLWIEETDVAHRQISVHKGGNPVLG